MGAAAGTALAVTRRPKLLLDEMLSGEIAAQLRARGHDVRAVVEDPALVSTSDWDLLEYVTAQGRCLVTANVRDFRCPERNVEQPRP